MGSKKLNGPIFMRWLYILDDVDRHYSLKIMQHSSLTADVLVGVWAHFFNRKQILISLTLAWIIGAFTYNTWLPNLGFKPLERETSGFDKFRLGCCAFFTYGFGLIMLLIFAQTFKYTIKRPRPTIIPELKRPGLNLRGGEDGTYSMPSGDSAAGACFC